MNLPNQLTVLRMALVPVFVVLMLATCYGAALIVFVVASLTDLLDGHIARSRGLVTSFGKLMDPLADKILVMSAMLCLVELGWAPSFVVIMILAREFLVTSLRLIAAGDGIVIAADRWGKIKTVVQMTWIITTLLWMHLAASPFLAGLSPSVVDVGVRLLITVLMWAALFFTAMSGFNYCYQNRALFLREL